MLTKRSIFFGLATGLIFSSVGCSAPDDIGPQINALAPHAEWFVGQASEYSGQLERGIFKLCTSRIAAPGWYYYAVHTFSRKNGDSDALVLMTPGSCVIVNSSKNNGVKSADDSVRVQYDHTFVAGFPFVGDVFSTLDGAVLIDDECVEECILPGFPSTLTMSGKAGAVSKFYFLPPGFQALGGHGGGGTESFAID